MSLEEKIKQHIRDVTDYPKPGIVFKDITPLLATPQLLSQVIREMVDRFKDERIDSIVAIEARGFILGSILAHELNCGFIPVRKVGKLPYKTLSQDYALEYGTSAVEIHTDAVRQGSRVLVHDDLLATGGTAAAAAKLVKQSGGNLISFSFLINLSFLQGEQNLVKEFGIKPHCLITY